MAQADELYCLLIPIAGGRLLLPNTAITEVVGYTAVQPSSDGPSWLLGDVLWEGMKVPLMSFEAANGSAAPEPSPRTRVAILYNIGEQLDDNYFAITTQGHPHLIRVDRNVLARAPEESQEDGAALCRVQIGTQQAVIPDLERLEALLARQRAAAAEIVVPDDAPAESGSEAGSGGEAQSGSEAIDTSALDESGLDLPELDEGDAGELGSDESGSDDSEGDEAASDESGSDESEPDRTE